MGRDDAGLAGQAARPADHALVEVHGVGGPVDAGGGHASVDPNGKRGLADWDPRRGEYLVHTFDGFFVHVPEANLRACANAGPEEGGFDVVWPINANAYASFAHNVVEILQEKAYCVIQMFKPRDVQSSTLRAATERISFMRFKKEFEESYLGCNSNSKVAWLDGRSDSMTRQPVEQEVRDQFVYYDDNLNLFCKMFCSVAGDSLGFEPWRNNFGSLLRMPFIDDSEKELLHPEPLSGYEAETGEIEYHLDFLQRKRLCMMYLVNGDEGALELHAKGGSGQEVVRIPATPDKLVVFHLDRLRLDYKPGGSQDVVLQSWILRQPEPLSLEGFDSAPESLQTLYGAPPQNLEKQVHVKASTTRFPGAAHQNGPAWCMFGTQTDGFVEIPIERFDMGPYYSDQPGAFGKAYAKHAGFLDTREWIEFDNRFFGIADDTAACMPPPQRVMLETTFELLKLGGFPSLESTRGARVHCAMAECAVEWDTFWGMQAAPQAFLSGNNNMGGTCNRLMYAFGLVGFSSLLDTACSSGLVAANIIHARLRQHDVKDDATDGLALGQTCDLQPFPFIGLSQAGMIGPAGRTLFADSRANGMQRGEGTGGVFLHLSDSMEAIQERLGCHVSSFINQDGRSASLTAPNGPSQQQCIRSCLRLESLPPTGVCVLENHGTGTALGDPIECGSVRACFNKRETSLAITTAKSHTGHLEAVAGLVNFIKILLSLGHATVAPNNHLRVLNQHIEIEGFPCNFPIERLDLASGDNMGGTNAFGFGGTNSHANIWVPAWVGPRSTRHSRLKISRLDYVAVACPGCSALMCWLCGAAVPEGFGGGKHHCAAIREGSDSYEYCSRCYTGTYLYGSDTIAEDAPLDPSYILDNPDVEDDSWDMLVQTVEEDGVTDAGV
eukprot:CAMPEP_0179280134 /NCGR_PEP_ID=MMETSP0797-20121207/36472_1 /TAXON_ID=47934 /ORGANISM="Dinophysis acuminata, Strain DAEP01" /LENGTH=893 /DNA_ID=CAMNT_0020988783 /DNA_START=35 /DNA_END=2716 /DNA_ORIENTATION=+